MTTIRDNLQTIGAKLTEYSNFYHRAPSDVQLLAVSKKHPVEAIEEAYIFGQRAFGENYVQELLDKAEYLQKLNIEWHFIGPLQSNKTKKIAELVDWVHTIDRLKVAKRLSDQRPEELPSLNICIQVNISGEATKSGIMATEVEALAQEISKLPRLKLRGLMTIPSTEANFEKQRQTFAEVTNLKNNLNQQGFELDTLSMGMTGDMKAAIAEDATIVRIGTAIFGARDYN